jgi:hypothetical protein
MEKFVVIGRCVKTGFQFCPREFSTLSAAKEWINGVVDGTVSFTLWNWSRGTVVSESTNAVS